MSVQLQRGANISLTKTAPSLQQVAIGLGWDAQSSTGAAIDLDASAFMLADTGRVPGDDYFIFFNQLRSPEGAVAHQGDNTTGLGAGDDEVIHVTLSQVPASIQKVVFTVTIYEAEARQQHFGMVNNAFIRVVNLANQQELARYNLTETVTSETAMIFGELYRYRDEWKFRAVGQGFAGGLPAMANTFGVDVEGTPAPPPAAPQSADRRVILEKKLAEKAPHLVSLAKKAAISLEKVNLSDHQAKVALCLDISGSMQGLYDSGKVQQLAERVLALGTRFDDDGAIDIFLFGEQAHNVGQMDIDNFSDFIKQIISRYPLEPNTLYDRAMQLIREFYFPGAPSGSLKDTAKSKLSLVRRFFSEGPTLEEYEPRPADQPVYVMFVTDGNTGNPSATEKQLQLSSYEPIFWQFMAIGQGGFHFLESLDDLKGRYLDNADFFSVADPLTIPDDRLYDLLMTEYPKWVNLARNKNLLP